MSVRVRVVALIIIVLLSVLVILRLRGTGGGEEEITTDVAVHVGQVSRSTLHRYVTAYGRLEPAPALDGEPAGGALITPFVDGVVSEVVAVEGQPVRKGSVLFRMDSRLAEVAVQRARQELVFADSALSRQERLLAEDGTSQKAYLEARLQRDAARSNLDAAETDLAYLALTSPLDGTVLRVQGKVGQRVDASTVLAQVVDMDRLVVAANVPVREIQGIDVGRPVLMGAGDSVPEGSVLVVGRDVDPLTGSYRVQASVPAGTPYLPGQFVEIRIVAAEHADVLVVPEVSVVSRGGEGSWICLVEGDRAVRHPVTVGLEDGGWVEVSGEGLREGMEIVTVEAYSLPEETRIHIVSN